MSDEDDPNNEAKLRKLYVQMEEYGNMFDAVIEVIAQQPKDKQEKKD